MNIEFDVTLNCNFSCLNCNRHSNFNSLENPHDRTKSAGLNYYDNTNVSMNAVDKLISDVKLHGGIKRIHVIGGEPLTHPEIDRIVDKLRDELLGLYVPDIVIISNLHPKMIKAGTLDTPKQIVQNFPFDRIDTIQWGYTPSFLPALMKALADLLKSTRMTTDVLSDKLSELVVQEDPNKKTTAHDILSTVKMFRGMLVSNFTTLADKSDVHRCSLVSPYDSGQEMMPLCNIPNKCGANYSFDGYWPCSQGAAIARMFNLTQYNRKDIPMKFEDWGDVDSNGNAIVNSKSNMWELCKHCQLSAKTKMLEKDHGRPISISYRKALGIEGDSKPLSPHVVPSHKKNLATSIYLEKCETECKS